MLSHWLMQLHIQMHCHSFHSWQKPPEQSVGVDLTVNLFAVTEFSSADHHALVSEKHMRKQDKETHLRVSISHCIKSVEDSA